MSVSSMAKHVHLFVSSVALTLVLLLGIVFFQQLYAYHAPLAPALASDDHTHSAMPLAPALASDDHTHSVAPRHLAALLG